MDQSGDACRTSTSRSPRRYRPSSAPAARMASVIDAMPSAPFVRGRGARSPDGGGGRRRSARTSRRHSPGRRRTGPAHGGATEAWRCRGESRPWRRPRCAATASAHVASVCPIATVTPAATNCRTASSDPRTLGGERHQSQMTPAGGDQVGDGLRRGVDHVLGVLGAATGGGEERALEVDPRELVASRRADRRTSAASRRGRTRRARRPGR